MISQPLLLLLRLHFQQSHILRAFPLMEWIVPTLGIKCSLIGNELFPQWECFSRFCWRLCLVLYGTFWSFRAEISHLSTFLCKCFIYNCLADWEKLRISPWSLPHLSCYLHFTWCRWYQLEGWMEGLGRGEGGMKIISQCPELLCLCWFWEICWEMRDFYPNVMFSTSTGSWRKIWACSLNLLGFSVVR